GQVHRHIADVARHARRPERPTRDGDVFVSRSTVEYEAVDSRPAVNDIAAVARLPDKGIVTCAQDRKIITCASRYDIVAASGQNDVARSGRLFGCSDDSDARGHQFWCDRVARIGTDEDAHVVSFP